MKFRKNIAAMIIMSMTLAACGEKAPINNYYTNPATASEQQKTGSVLDTIVKDGALVDTKALTFNNWKKLVLTNDKNNYSLAKIFASHVSASDKEEVEKYIEENLSTEDVQAIIDRVGANYEKKKTMYLYHDAPWSANKDFINDSLMKLDEVNVDAGVLEKQLIIETSAKIKNKFLEDILTSYTKAVEATAVEVAPSFAAELEKTQPETVSKIEKFLMNGEKEAAIETLRKGLEKLDYFNQIRIDAQLKDKQVIIGGIAGAVAFVIYEQIKETKSFVSMKKVVEDAKAIAAKLEKAKKIVDAIRTIHEKTVKDIKDFKDATADLGKGSSELFDVVKKDLDKNPDRDMPFKDQLKSLYGNLFKKKAPETPVGRYKNQIDKVDTSLEKMSASFTSMAKNFDEILDQSVALAGALGIKLGKDAQKVLKAAKTVTKIVNVAAATFKGFLSGGFVGAGMALFGSAGTMFGGGKSAEAAAQEKILEQLAVMDLKLDEILKLQKETIQLQLETMKMIRDLALMVEDFHQDEMRAISLLRDDVLTGVELGKVQLNTNIRQCELLIEHQISDASNSEPIDINSDDSSLMDMTHKSFYGSLKQYSSFESIIRGATFDGFSNCQVGINNAFGSLSPRENPILAIYNSNEDANFLNYQKNVYRPLLRELNESVVGDKFLIQFPLHLPMKSMRSLEKKYTLMSNPMALSGRATDVYGLNNLVSPLALTRYASSLLILYPLLDFDRDTWMNGPNAIVDRFFADLVKIPSVDGDDYQVYLKTRSLRLLKNALYLTQSSIAQETLLSGEPLLNRLYEKRAELFKNENPCKAPGKESLECAIYSNRLLVKNFLTYTLLKTGQSENYAAAMAQLSGAGAAALEDILSSGTGIFKGKIKFHAKAGYYLQLALEDQSRPSDITLPSVESLKEMPVLYSENMIKLLKLQLKIIDAIIEVSPQFMRDGLDAQYSALILSNSLK